ncbi:MAG: fatty acid desaturase family protein [Isosphaerales bacterium]
MAASVDRPTFEDAALQREIMQLRQVDNHTNLFYLALEYLSLGSAIGGAVAFAEYRASWGISWFWNVPVFTMAIILIGGIQHRLAGLGHESSHYSFMKNWHLNDLIPDLFCMFPLMTTIHFYRLFHMGHHQFTNDPDRDPDLLNLGHGKRAGEFPMLRRRFIALVYFSFLVAPMRFLRYQWAYFQVNTLGKGKSVYMERPSLGHQRFTSPWPRLATLLGIVYILGLSVVLRFVTGTDRPLWLAPVGLLGIALLAAVTYALPDWAVFQSPFRQAYSPRIAGVLRMSYYTALLVVLAHFRWASGGRSAIYPVLLWIVPLGTSFMFFMYLRDVYQHSNADTGRLTNSRVFFTDPFTRWAVFVYGQDMHIPHHLFPAVPHYRLRRLHRLLKSLHAAYRDQVVETHGTFHDSLGRPTILDEMSRSRANPAVTDSRTG